MGRKAAGRVFRMCRDSERGAGVLFVIEVDEVHGRAFFTCLSVFADAGVFKQKGEGVAVAVGWVLFVVEVKDFPG